MKHLSGNKKKQREGARYAAYVVFQGLRPGVYTVW